MTNSPKGKRCSKAPGCVREEGHRGMCFDDHHHRLCREGPPRGTAIARPTGASAPAVASATGRAPAGPGDEMVTLRLPARAARKLLADARSDALDVVKRAAQEFLRGTAGEAETLKLLRVALECQRTLEDLGGL